MCEKEISSPTIKLFGKTIPLASPTNHDPPRGETRSAAAAAQVDDDDDGDEDLSVKLSSCSETTTSFAKPENKETISGNETAADKEEENPSDQGVTEDLKPRTASSGISEIPKTPPADEETDETSSTQDKTPKKPEKIVPCPRCDSMNTKFCYYNNYNVNQPRHFCKNCQRYWTAGGIMRNVPVGAGRRKNKNASSVAHYRDISMSASLQTSHSTAAAAAAASNGVHNPNLGRNSTVLSFGSDSPLCESMAYVRDQQRILVPSVAKDIADDQSCGSSNVTTSYSSERVCLSSKQEPTVRNCQVFSHHQVPCFPAAPWPYPWNSPQWTSAMPPPAFFHSRFPISVYPAPPYWGCTTPCSWNVPCNSPPSSTLSHCGTPSGPYSVTSGKHPRDEDIHNQDSRQNKSGCVLIPKTLRIGDPREAAKSSIWETLGIKNEKGSSINKGGIFKSFQPVGDEGRLVVEQSSVLQANPAAFSRSLHFNERS